jgi:hypothetical protein
MADVVDWSGYLNNSEKAAKAIGQLLHREELALFVGAGISFDHGAPSWHALARAMARDAGVESAGINRKKINGGELDKIFSRIKRNYTGNFDELVKKWLYRRWGPAKAGNWASNTLVALGSLMLGTRRGRIDTVVSTNFDSILEMYLRLYGYVTQSISTYPTLLHHADVRVFHSHGYLPLDGKDGNPSDILLTQSTYLEAIGEDNHPRKKMMEYVFAQKKILAVGLSGDDTFSNAILAVAAKKGTFAPPRGFWVVGPNVSEDKVEQFKEAQLAAVRLPSYKHLPEFLFSVARHAAVEARI